MSELTDKPSPLIFCFKRKVTDYELNKWLIAHNIQDNRKIPEIMMLCKRGYKVEGYDYWIKDRDTIDEKEYLYERKTDTWFSSDEYD